jgi:3-deoxy-D-manno-octulosonate 8-phosphate phosphatase (KDO 8-P phosphatase)
MRRGAAGFPLERARGVRLLALDVDGVLTGGQIFMDDDGGETKAFNVRDGHGIKLLQRAGIEVAIVTGRTSGVVACRARDLGIAHVIQGCLNKMEGLQTVLEAAGAGLEECAFMGDDVLDLPPMRACRLGFSPADAHPAALARADWVSDLPGGGGAVRQAAEGLILANGAWEDVIGARYGASPADCGWDI